MAWRPAYSLQSLKTQLDTNYPGWLFLGFLGDASHASVPSDHNPNAEGVVCALDIGPGGGLDIHGLADNIAANPHPDLKYIISNRRIAEWQYSFAWRPYSGSDPHDTHIHVSVGRGQDGQSTQPYDDQVLWNITAKGEEMVDDQGARDLLTTSMMLAQNGDTPDRQPTLDEVKNLIGRTYIDAMAQIRSYEPWKHNYAMVKYYPKDVQAAYEKGKAEGDNPGKVLAPGKYEVK
jgi:hypothetical protein